MPEQQVDCRAMGHVIQFVSHVAAELLRWRARQISRRNLWFSKNAIFRFDGAAVDVLYCLNTCKTSFRQDLQDYQDYESSANQQGQT